MLNRAMAFRVSGNETGEMSEYDRLIACFETSDIQYVQVRVADAIFSRAVKLAVSDAAQPVAGARVDDQPLKNRQLGILSSQHLLYFA